MNEKQKRIYGLLKQLYFENELEYPEDANNTIHAVHRVISYVFYTCDDDDFIPVLKKFINEVEE